MAAAPPPLQPPPPQVFIERLGRPAFHDDFTTLDAGPDLAGGPAHKWRTVLGSGGPLALANRSFGGDVVFVEPAFPGVDQYGRLGPTPLGLEPFGLTAGGGLNITASRTSQSLKSLLWNKGWYSGVLTTKLSFSVASGYWEITADLPVCTHGAWGAIWLLPTTGVWPNGGEIDGPESIGDGRLHYTLHSSTASPPSTAWPPPTGCHRGLHRYGILNTRTAVAFYYDGRLLSAEVGSSRVDLQACKLEYSIVSPK